MPAYDYVCVCGFEDEIIHPVRACDDVWACPDCGAAMRRRLTAVATIGAMPSKPIVLGQTGIAATSNSEVREYERQNPNHRVVSSADSWWRRHKDTARENAEAQARKQGWRDLDERIARQKEAKAKNLPAPPTPADL